MTAKEAREFYIKTLKDAQASNSGSLEKHQLKLPKAFRTGKKRR